MGRRGGLVFVKCTLVGEKGRAGEEGAIVVACTNLWVAIVYSG
jgi:hypothetical protein